MKYTVHIYAVYRVPVDVEADSQQDAIAKAAAVDFDCERREFADEITGFLVDEDGDEEHLNSRSYDWQGKAEDAAPAAPVASSPACISTSATPD